MKLKVTKIQNNSNSCIVCGLGNALGLQAHFYETEGDYIVAVCTGRNEHQSYPNRMHGGVICALLDETVGRAVQIANPDVWGVTGDLKIKFRKPVPLGKKIFCVGKITRDTSRIFVAKGFVEDEEGTLLAECEATYFKAPVNVITGTDNFEKTAWFHDHDAPKYEFIDIKNLAFFDKNA